MSKKVASLPEDLPGSGWYEILPDPAPAVELEGNKRADWIIVGAGFAGLTAAMRLAELRPSDSIIILDAQRVGYGAAGRNSGFMIDLPHDLSRDNYTAESNEDLRQIRLNRAAIAYAKGVAEKHNFGDVFSFCGKMHGAATLKGRKRLEHFVEGLKVMEQDYSVLSAADLKTVVGTDFYQWGIHTPGAAIIKPAAYVRKLADSLPDNVSLYENSPAIELSPGSTPKVLTPRGSVTGGRVILTVNGHAQSFGYFKGRLMHLFTYASMTRKLTVSEEEALGGQKEWGMISADPMGTTVRRISEGRVVVRNSFTYNPKMETSAKRIKSIGSDHDRSFVRCFPMLQGVGMEYRWGGHLCVSLNNGHGFGKLDEGVFGAVCQNGLGVCKGTLSGLMLANELCGVSSELLNDFKSLGLPRRLPPLTSLAAPLVLKWREFLAGKEK